MLLFLSKEQQTSGSEPAIFAQRRQTEVAEAETEAERGADIVVVVVVVVVMVMVMVLVMVLQRGKENAARRRGSAYL
jgi:lipopolysaccharide/colanic/teichoic acid biosynthesis glycosyltransferase